MSSAGPAELGPVSLAPTVITFFERAGERIDPAPLMPTPCLIDRHDKWLTQGNACGLLYHDVLLNHPIDLGSLADPAEPKVFSSTKLGAYRGFGSQCYIIA